MNGDPSFGYDALPQYNYAISVSPGDPNQPTPWINLDETDQITLNNMYAGVVAPGSSPNNSQPQLIRFLAKANRSQFTYVAGNSNPNDPMNQWWASIPAQVVSDTKAFLVANQKSPPAGSKTMVSLPYGTIEIKAGWRPLNPAEAASGRFHTQLVRFYERNAGNLVYFNATWGLVALHIIQKTPTAPYFIYATFEQADNILTADGKPVEDVDGRIIAQPVPPTATTPQVCLVDPQPPVVVPPPPGGESPSNLGSVILSADPATGKPLIPPKYCDTPNSSLYYRNAPITPPTSNSAPSGGNICVNKRDNPIPDYAIDANARRMPRSLRT